MSNSSRPTLVPSARVGRKIEVDGPWGELARAAGGMKELAESLGVSTSTLWRWVTEKVPARKSTRIMVAAKAAALGVDDPFEVTAKIPKAPRVPS